MWAGQGLRLVTSEQTAAEIVDQVVQGAAAALNAREFYPTSRISA
jgi:NAD(P)H-dependent flavin oxidoreductase YrpB (nitropropane dioxygenase family)